MELIVITGVHSINPPLVNASKVWVSIQSIYSPDHSAKLVSVVNILFW